MSRRYFWLKLPETFFRQKEIRGLRRKQDGAELVIIYQEIMLESIAREGRILFEGYAPTLAEELADNIGEDPEKVRIVLDFLEEHHLMEWIEDDEAELPGVVSLIGSETDAAERMRKSRSKEIKVPKPDPKSGAERQEAYRAKRDCINKPNVPKLDDSTNKKRYGGNYYICFKRDGCACALCGSEENLCLHHIDGYDEKKPQNNARNKMITLCRTCHGSVHGKKKIPDDILEKIGYFGFIGASDENGYTSDENGYTSDENGYTEIEKEIEIEKEQEIEKDTLTSPEETDSASGSKAEPVPYSQIMAAYNEILGDILPNVQKIDGNRRKLTKARYKEAGSVDELRRVFELVRESDFLSGRSGAWQANFDWIIKPANFQKIREGNYRNRERSSGSPAGGGRSGRVDTLGVLEKIYQEDEQLEGMETDPVPAAEVALAAPVGFLGI